MQIAEVLQDIRDIVPWFRPTIKLNLEAPSMARPCLICNGHMDDQQVKRATRIGRSPLLVMCGICVDKYKNTSGMVNPVAANKLLLESGLLFEINRTLLHQFGLALAVDDTGAAPMSLLATSDPEGLTFTETQYMSGRSRFKRFVESCVRLLNRRAETLGEVTQHIE